MELFVLDDTFKSLYNLDVFESLIWTERYNGYGNFEFYTPVSQSIIGVVNTVQKKMEAKLDCYVWLKESGSAMVIEDLEITTDIETGNHLIVSGRGLESLLERRIIWKQTVLNGNLQAGIRRLIEEALTNPEMDDRQVSNFLFSESDDEIIRSLKLKAQYTGDNLYDTILTICETYQLGFDVRLDENRFIFSLKRGEDRSYDQNKNPYVVFSPNYENMVNSDYLESGKTLKNVTLVAGEDEGSSRRTIVVGSGVGLSRRELYTDARDIQSENYKGQLEDDTEILNGYKQDLADTQQLLSEETTNFAKETEEYEEKQTAYLQAKSEYENRITVITQRITFYNQKVVTYTNSLTAAQKTSLTSRNSYKSQVESYETLITSCNNKISDYNNKLRNEKTLTYEKVVQYETGIEAEEALRKQYEAAKKPLKESQEAEEENLPNFETQLQDYEDKISKYQDIVSDDQKTLSEETENFSKETTSYQKKQTAYETKKTKYESDIITIKQKIDEYEAIIVEDQNALDELYYSLLEQRGKEKLSEKEYTKAFTSEIEATKTFIYDRDFFKGDIVQIVNEYGMESKVLVSEVVRAQDTSGYSMYPTFKVME